MSRPRLSRYLPRVAAALLPATTALILLGLWLRPPAAHTISGLQLGSVDVGGLSRKQLLATLQVARQRLLTREIALRADLGRESASIVKAVTPTELGFDPQVEQTATMLLSAGRTGSWLLNLWIRLRAAVWGSRVSWIMRFEASRGQQILERLRDRVEREPDPPRLDFRARQIRPAREGRELRPYDSLLAIERAVSAEASTVALVLARIPPPAAPWLRGLDISTVLGDFETVYSLASTDRDRAHNLELVASKLDRQVLGPGAKLSYNEVVGTRTEYEGYRTAAVVYQGELVDGMAGGACQISSTLFAAAFFAGLDLVSSRPHTMPSSYVKMGLDAAVAYPYADLVIANPYPFPIAINVEVSQGRVKARIFGKQRPWKKVEFRRLIERELPFERIERPDPQLPSGLRVVSQRGYPGYVIERQRLLYAASATPERVERRKLQYLPIPEILRVGSGSPDLAYPQPPAELPARRAPEAELMITR